MLTFLLRGAPFLAFGIATVSSWRLIVLIGVLSRIGSALVTCRDALIVAYAFVVGSDDEDDGADDEPRVACLTRPGHFGSIRNRLAGP